MLMKIFLIITALSCTACGSRDEEVIRLLVTAEVAEKQSIEPDLVKVTSVEIRGGTEATAKAEYSPLASRGADRIRLTCRLTLKVNRWQVESCAMAGS
jgi:hypothetical protein